MPFGVDRPLPDDFEVAPIVKRPGKHLFGPGHMGPRKQKGQVAKITRDIKNGIVTAAENLGRVDLGGDGGLVGYLEYVGLYHPKAFCHLLGKLMPLQVNSDSTSRGTLAVNIVSVPSGRHFTHEEVDALDRGEPVNLDPCPGPAPLIEHQSEPALEPAPASTDEIMRRAGALRVV